MKIDNLVRIIDGNLHTHPSIDAFERIVFDASRILRGDLYIDVDENAEHTKLASEKGAYAIISTRPFDGDDSELAWICVPSIEQALIKFLRYQVAQKSPKLLEFLLLGLLQRQVAAQVIDVGAAVLAGNVAVIDVVKAVGHGDDHGGDGEGVKKGGEKGPGKAKEQGNFVF